MYLEIQVTLTHKVNTINILLLYFLFNKYFFNFY